MSHKSLIDTMGKEIFILGQKFQSLGFRDQKYYAQMDDEIYDERSYNKAPPNHGRKEEYFKLHILIDKYIYIERVDFSKYQFIKL